MANQRTTLKVGRASADVSLMKASGKLVEAQHEVRRVVVNEPAEAPAVEQQPELNLDLFAPFDEGPIIEPVRAPAPAAAPAPAQADVDPFAQEEQPPPVELATAPATTVVEERIEWGVWHAESWVDLTEQLKAIDINTKIDGMNIEATVSLAHVPRELVRDAHYVLPRDQSSHKFVCMVYVGLKRTGKAAVVRWTKRTNQALGVVVARGNENNAHLVVLELAWQETLRALPPAGLLDLDVLSEGQMAAAGRAMERLVRPASYIEGLHDTRNEQRAKLLERARAGKPIQAVEARTTDDEIERVAALFASVK
jgi:hypothetical protein